MSLLRVTRAAAAALLLFSQGAKADAVFHDNLNKALLSCRGALSGQLVPADTETLAPSLPEQNRELLGKLGNWITTAKTKAPGKDLSAKLLSCFELVAKVTPTCKGITPLAFNLDEAALSSLVQKFCDDIQDRQTRIKLAAAIKGPSAGQTEIERLCGTTNATIEGNPPVCRALGDDPKSAGKYKPQKPDGDPDPTGGGDGEGYGKDGKRKDAGFGSTEAGTNSNKK